ncbi:MAG: GGDEF domain-containing protein, partial [Rhizobiales bacterium]|nr:GGDEF domain-containing protein [Hyphomicrobiales bacterium]
LDSMAERLSAREQDLRTQSEHFRELASVDSLTGLSNRRTFDAYAAAIWERSVRHQDPIGVLMIDVDYFKRFNDHYGHMHGDTCLRAIAEILQDVARPHGRAARYGGEEFALLLPGSVANARARAEAIRHAVMALRVPHAESPHGVATVSIGVAAIVPDRSAKLATLLAEADTALYASKQRRNAVSVFERVELAQAG